MAGILLAAIVSVIFPAEAAAWGNPIDSQYGIWNVKKPYNSGWGHCACSGGICPLNYAANSTNNSGSDSLQVSAAVCQQTDCTAGKVSIAYLVPTGVTSGVIDCTKDATAKIRTIDCTNSTSSVSAGYSPVYVPVTSTCRTRGTCTR
ncbi:MAG: hypothetical protein PHO26_02335 [Dehalococcoidia bacterium]|nr:hypothetical protein [Dehalococcoidia bacterium]MDD5494981.1 hypothetical protein [Dehalococcoidia bacterium]